MEISIQGTNSVGMFQMFLNFNKRLHSFSRSLPSMSLEVVRLLNQTTSMKIFNCLVQDGFLTPIAQEIFSHNYKY